VSNNIKSYSGISFSSSFPSSGTVAPAEVEAPAPAEPAEEADPIREALVEVRNHLENAEGILSKFDSSDVLIVRDDSGDYLEAEPSESLSDAEAKKAQQAFDKAFPELHIKVVDYSPSYERYD
jgi:hypothetical protein